MAAIDFNLILKDLVEQAKEIAISTFKDYKKEAGADAENLVSVMKVKLEKWSKQLANNEISKDDLIFLVQGQRELIEMKALKQTGIALIKVEELKNSILKATVNTIVSCI